MAAPARITLIATVLALAVLAPATASGQTQLPVGESKGVRIVRPHGSVVLVFSPSAARLRERINSRYAWISCTNLDKPFSSTGSGNLDVRDTAAGCEPASRWGEPTSASSTCASTRSDAHTTPSTCPIACSCRFR